MAVQVVEFASLFNDEIARFFDVLSKAFLILFTKIPPFQQERVGKYSPLSSKTTIKIFELYHPCAGNAREI